MLFVEKLVVSMIAKMFETFLMWKGFGDDS